MKKLLKVSLVAILAVGPVAAFAGTIPAAYTDGSTTTKPTLTPSNVLATKTYVQGAYNELVQSINLEDQKVGALDSATLTAFGANTPASLAAAVNSAMAAAQNAAEGNGLNESQVNAQINEAAGNGLSTSADGVLAVNLGENKGLEINSDALEVKTGTGLTVDSTGVHLTEAVQSSLGKADTALQSTNIGSGLAWDATNGVTLSTANQTKIDAALTSDSTLNGAKLDTGTVAKTALADAVQSSLNKADSALQSGNNVSLLTNDAGYITDAAIDGLASETYVDNKAAATLQSAQNYVDERGVVAATTWGVDTSVLVTLSSSAN